MIVKLCAPPSWAKVSFRVFSTELVASDTVSFPVVGVVEGAGSAARVVLWVLELVTNGRVELGVLELVTDGRVELGVLELVTDGRVELGVLELVIEARVELGVLEVVGEATVELGVLELVSELLVSENVDEEDVDVEVTTIGVWVALSKVAKSVAFSAMMGNCVIQLAIWAERDGSFHQGFSVQAGASDVEFREVVVVAVFVPEQVVTVWHEVVVVKSVKTVPLDVMLDTISLHVVYVADEQELEELDELEELEESEVLIDRDGSGEPDCSPEGPGPELPVVHGAAVQWVVGNVNEAEIAGGTGGKFGGDGGNGNPNLPKQGMWQFANRLRIHLTASLATDMGFPQLSLHNGPTHFQSKLGKTI
jgi:hypothetical protein